MDMTTGSKIRVLRVQHGLTQEELGAKVGVSKATINKYESGAIDSLKRTTIAALAEALECSPAFLMGWETVEEELAAEESLQRIGKYGQRNARVRQLAEKRAEQNEVPQKHSAEELELLRIYNALPVRARLELLKAAYALEDENT